MKYTVEMGSGAMIYMPSFIKIGSAIQKLIGGGNIQTQRQHGDHISLILFFISKDSRLITRMYVRQEAGWTSEQVGTWLPRDLCIIMRTKWAYVAKLTFLLVEWMVAWDFFPVDRVS
jgi:hypothetical protein